MAGQLITPRWQRFPNPPFEAVIEEEQSGELLRPAFARGSLPPGGSGTNLYRRPEIVTILLHHSSHHLQSPLGGSVPRLACLLAKAPVRARPGDGLAQHAHVHASRLVDAGLGSQASQWEETQTEWQENS